MTITLRVNGRATHTGAAPTRRLSDVLREDLDLRGTKVGCDAGDCGACTVLMDGAPVCACLVPVAQAAGTDVETVEGLAVGEDGGLTRLGQAFLDHGAAQCGICTPGMLVAATALLRDTPSPTPEAVAEALGGVLCRCTGYRKIIDAVCDIAGAAPASADPGPGGAVGCRIRRLDGAAKISGRERFGADDWPPDALMVRVVRCPHDHAQFTFGDLSGWRAARPGIVAVFTAGDIPGPNRHGVIEPFADQPALADGIARFRGEAVALVAGEGGASWDLDGFPITWQPLPAALTPEMASLPEAPRLHETRPGNRLTRGRVRSGEVEAALSQADVTAEGRLQTAYVEHAYIEPEAGCAWMEGEVLVLRACTQAPAMDRDDTARILGLPPDRVRILPAAAGGGFGGKLDLSVQPLVGLVALKTGRAARLVYGRRESMISSTKRHPAAIEARIGAAADGTLTSLRFRGVFNTGAYASWGPTVANRVPVHAGGPYRIPNLLAETEAIHTNGPIAGAFRGFGVPQAATLVETLFDELADRLGLDPLEFRRRNAFRDGDRTATGQRLAGGVGMIECLDAVAPHWRSARRRAADANSAGGRFRHGVGVACCWYGCGNTSLPNPSTIKVGLATNGDVVLHQGATDIGQGANTVISQICADALGLPVSAFRLVGNDTFRTPDAGKTSASRQTYVSGKAAELAGRQLRSQILQRANMGDTARLVPAGHVLQVMDEDRTQPLDLSAMPADGDGLVLTAISSYDPPTTPLDADGQGSPYAVYGYGVQLVELAVDRDLGTVRLDHIVAAHDVGRAINPTLAEGQIEGGIAQGIGMALMEEYLPGRTENLHDYLIATAGDVPPITTILVEKPDPEGPFGAKGLGEHALIPTAPAILNAIRHATGVRLARLPALPHRILAAVAAKT